MTSILILPDAHCKPRVDNDRFEWLGKYIVETTPDRIICLGDFFDGPSLSLYDVGKKSFHGRTYKDDVAATIDGQTRLFKPISDYNTALKAKKQKLYKPEMTMLMGNHEWRIIRAIEMDSKLDGTIGLDDLCYERFGWNTHPYKEIVDIEGIYATHIFTTGLMDRPIGGVNIARTVLNKIHDNAIFGHTHVWDHASTSLPNGRKITAINAGCYFTHKEDYVTQRAQNEWTRGITTIQVEKKEVVDFNFVDIRTLKKEYGR